MLISLQHYKTVQGTDDSNDAAITFTATASASGSLLIGSSREFVGFDREKSASVEHAILCRASQFLPDLASVLPEDSQTRCVSPSSWHNLMHVNACLQTACPLPGHLLCVLL